MPTEDFDVHMTRILQERAQLVEERVHLRTLLDRRSAEVVRLRAQNADLLRTMSSAGLLVDSLEAEVAPTSAPPTAPAPKLRAGAGAQHLCRAAVQPRGVAGTG